MKAKRSGVPAYIRKRKSVGAEFWCPFCRKAHSSVVTDSRLVGQKRVRRRTCLKCRRRYTTIEAHDTQTS